MALEGPCPPALPPRGHPRCGPSAENAGLLVLGNRVSLCLPASSLERLHSIGSCCSRDQYCALLHSSGILGFDVKFSEGRSQQKTSLTVMNSMGKMGSNLGWSESRAAGYQESVVSIMHVKELKGEWKIAM